MITFQFEDSTSKEDKLSKICGYQEKPVTLQLFWHLNLKTAANYQMEDQNYGITQMLASLHTLDGGDFSRQVERISKRAEFHLLKGETRIFLCGGEKNGDYNNLLNAARKAVSHGYNVYILPNPKGIRTPDFIFEHKGIYRVYDLKTIYGKASAGNRLKESIGQTNRILLNMRCDYKAKILALDIKAYFEASSSALEVLVIKGHKLIPVNRNMALGKQFISTFRKLYER